jgi:DNA gyrase subunit A
MGRTARGVRGIRLDDDDFVVGAVLVEEGKPLMTITELGYGKQTPFDDFRLMKNRGGSGVCCHKLSDKTGNLAGIAAVAPGDDLMLITDQGTMIRTPVADINVYSRTASGVIVMRTGEDQKIVNFTKLAPEEPEGQDQLVDAPEESEEAQPVVTPSEDVVVPVLEEEQE